MALAGCALRQKLRRRWSSKLGGNVDTSSKYRRVRIGPIPLHSPSKTWPENGAYDRARLRRRGHRGHYTANPHRVFISGQKRGVFGIIKHELRRRSAIEAVIDRMKTDGHLGRCYRKGPEGDAANVSSLPSATTSASFSRGSASAALNPAGACRAISVAPTRKWAS